MVHEVTPNSRPSSSKDRPERCSSTICRRNSGVYRLPLLAMSNTSLCDSDVSTKAGALSRGHRNNAGERFRWCLPIERLSRAAVQLSGDAIQMLLRMPREVGALWEVL